MRFHADALRRLSIHVWLGYEGEMNLLYEDLAKEEYEIYPLPLRGSFPFSKGKRE